MLRVVLFGCGVCVAYIAGRAGLIKLKEHAAKSGSGSEGSPMTIIAKAVMSVQDHIGPWSPPDVILGFAAMAKVTEKNPLPMPGHEVPELVNDAEFLTRAQHWRALAEAVYVSDPASFSLFSHLPESSIVSSQWQADQNSFRPAYALFLDYSFGGAALVLSIRGTNHVIDVLVNAGAHPVPFETGHGHEGFVRATHSLLSEVGPDIQRLMSGDDELKSKTRKLVIVGHSMGAAVGIMCGLKLRSEYPLECWGYSVPASVSLELARECSSFATSFVALHDVVPRFSITSIEELRSRVCSFDWKKAEECVGKDDEDWQKISKAVEMMQKFQSGVESVQKRACEAVGGSSDESCKEGKCESEENQEEESGVKVPGLFPPGRLLVLSCDPAGCGKVPGQRKGVAEQRSYGAFPSFEDAKRVSWVMHEAEQEDFSQIILSPWSVSDHMLGNICEGIHFFQKQVVNKS